MLHEAYWFRNMYKCKWGEVVLKSEKEEHEEEKHVPIKWKYCSFEAMKGDFGDHEENWDQKPKECQFCEQSIDFAGYLQHVNKCGSRTRVWEFCHHNVMMRNQKYHEQEEWARFIREEYEKKEKEKIQELEEEEKRKERVKDLQRKRKLKKEENEKAKAKPQRAPLGRAAAAPKPAAKEAAPKRSLPEYYGRGGASSHPTGIAGRTRSNRVKNEVPSSYKPARNRRGVKRIGEEEKEVVTKAKVGPVRKKPKHNEPKPNYSNEDVVMMDEGAANEIPEELLQQIYNEDLDNAQAMKVQNDEFSHGDEPQVTGERLIGHNMDDYSAPHRQNRNRRPSPPPPDMPSSMPPPSSGVPGSMPAPGGMEETENEMMQKAIAESLKAGNPRQYPMSKNF